MAEIDLKTAHHINALEKVREKMFKRNLDVLIATTAENFYYLSGWPSFWLSMTGIAGVSMLVLPRDDRLAPVAVVNEFEAKTIKEQSLVKEFRTYPVWIYVDDSRLPPDERLVDEGEKKPQFFDLSLSFNVLKEIVEDMGFEEKRIGVDSINMQRNSWDLLRATLDKAELEEASDLFYSVRMLKTDWEQRNLKRACSSAESAINKVVDYAALKVSDEQLKRHYMIEVQKDQSVDEASFILVSIGHDFSPSMYSVGNVLKEGDILRFDFGTRCKGYNSDLARSYVLGKSSKEQRRIYDALINGHMAGLEKLKPGNRMCDVYNAAMDTARSHGLPAYRRGHVGHSIGLSHTVEEPPFLSPGEGRLLEPGMIFCLELPYFAYNFGALQTEDMVLITEDGHDLLSHLPRELHVI